MTSIDQRIVEMQFNNRQFESNVQTSMNTIESLKKSLNLDGAARSLENLERVGRGFSLAGISDGLDAISNKFSTMGVVAFTALQNITNSVINTGKQIIASLTIDPIKSGLEEYETKINAITTILTNTKSKGTTLDDVNKALAELNLYADQTIYNFAEMTRNVGTFTAAGVDLQTSVGAIKGIANLAAGSGSNAQQASTAMYQLSQALAEGRMSLQSWNSVVNAGMGGELFQHALIDKAVQMGELAPTVAKSIKEGKIAFREAIKADAKEPALLNITKDMMVGVFNDFAKDKSLVEAATQVKTFTQLLDTMQEAVQSGWAQSWEYIIGDKDEAVKVLTAISDGFNNIIGASTNARNGMLQFWHDNGGRDVMIQAFSNAFKGLETILKPIGQAFREIFPATTGAQLVAFSKQVQALTSHFKIGADTANNLKDTFKGIFAVADIAKQAFVAVAKGVGTLVVALLPAVDAIFRFTGIIGKMLVEFDSALKKGNVFEKAVTFIADKITLAINEIGKAFKSFETMSLKGLDGFSGRVQTRFEPMVSLGGMIGKSFGKISEKMQQAMPTLLQLALALGKGFEILHNKITSAMNNVSFDSVLDVVNGGLFAALLLGIKKFTSSLTEIVESGSGLLGGVTDILDGVKGSLEAYQSQLKAGTLLKIAGAMALLAASIVSLSLIDSDKLAASLGAMSVMFVELFGSMGVFEKIMGGSGFTSMGKITRAMIPLSLSILILSSAMRNLSELDWEGTLKGLASIAALSQILVKVSSGMDKNSAGMIRGSIGLITFSTAINVLAIAVKGLAKLSVKELAKGLGAVGVLVAELAAFLKVTNLTGLKVGTGVGLIALAAAINILAVAVQSFAALSVNQLIKGLGAIGVVLTELALFTRATGNAKNVIATATGLTILGAAMLIFAQAVGTMGKLSVKEIVKGLGAMAGVLTLVTAALNFMPKNMIAIGIGFTTMAASLLILASALSTLGGMSVEEIVKSLGALGGSLLILALAVQAMSGALTGAAALLVVSTALAILTPSLVTLGSLSLEEIGKSLLALAGAFTIIGVAGLLLTPVVPTLLGLGGAILLLGVGALAAGAGLLAFSAGLSALAISGVAGATAIVAIVAAVTGSIPLILQKIGEGIIAFAKAIGNGAPALAKAAVAVVLAVLNAIVTTAPAVAKTIGVLLVTILDTITANLPKLLSSGITIIIQLLNGIASKLPDIIAAAANVIIAFLSGISKQLPRLIQAGFDTAISFINGIADALRNNTDVLITAIMNVGDAMVQGLIKGLFAGVKGIKDAVVNLGQTALDGLKQALGIHSPSKETQKIAEYTVQGFVIGLQNGTNQLATATQNTFEKGFLTPAKSTVDKIAKSMSYGSGAFRAFVDEYSTMSSRLSNVSALEKVSTSIQTLGKTLYEESEQYKTDTEALKKHNEELVILEAKYDTLSKTKRTKEINSQLKTLSKDISETKTQIINDEKAIVDNTEEAFNKLRDGISSSVKATIEPLKMSLDTQIKLFDKFGNDTEVEINDILLNMQSQVAGVQKWDADLNALAGKGFATGLLEQLRAMGPSGVNYIKAFSEMTFEEMQKANKSFEDASKLTASTLISNFGRSLDKAKEWARDMQELSKTTLNSTIVQALGKMGLDGSDYLDAFLEMSPAQIEDFNRKYVESLSLPDSVSDQVIASFINAGAGAADKFTESLRMVSAAENPNNLAVMTATNQLGVSAVTALSTGVEANKQVAITSATNTGLAVYNGFATYISEPKGRSLGDNMCKGLIVGLQNGSNAVTAAAASVAEKAYKAAKRKLDIHSPSKKFESLGKFSAMGMANGLLSYSNLTENASAMMANGMLTTMSSAMDSVSSVLNSDLDMSPTIRPIVDLTNVDSSLSKMNGMFSSAGTIDVSALTNRASVLSGRVAQQQTLVPTTTGVRGYGETVFEFNQYNTSPKALSRLDIYRQTNNQFAAFKEAVKST